jgi:hypothetical protein
MWLALAPSMPQAVPPQPPTVIVAPASPRGASTDVEAIRAVVRQELRAAAVPPPQAVPAPAAAVAPPPEKKEETPAEETAAPTRSLEYDNAQRLVEDGLSRRTWSPEDRSKLQLLMPKLSAAERDLLTRKLIVAANRGELKVDVNGPLF